MEGSASGSGPQSSGGKRKRKEMDGEGGVAGGGDADAPATPGHEDDMPATKRLRSCSQSSDFADGVSASVSVSPVVVSSLGALSVKAGTSASREERPDKRALVETKSGSEDRDEEMAHPHGFLRRKRRRPLTESEPSFLDDFPSDILRSLDLSGE